MYFKWIVSTKMNSKLIKHQNVRNSNSFFIVLLISMTFFKPGKHNFEITLKFQVFQVVFKLLPTQYIQKYDATMVYVQKNMVLL